MKTYISLPITGHNPADVAAAATRAKAKLAAIGHTPVSPLDLHPAGCDQSYGEYMGADIACLIDDCDAVYFLSGWRQSKGCMLEWYAAGIYGKAIMYESALDNIRGIPAPAKQTAAL